MKLVQKKNSLKIFLPFYKFLLADGIVKEDTLFKMKKIKLKLTSLQVKFLKTWSNHYRYTYNKTINMINEDDVYIEPAFRNFYKPFGKDTDNNFIKRCSRNTHYSDFELRNIIIPEQVNSKIKWILETPKAIRESAVFEATKNMKSAITNLKNGHIKYFKLNFKKKKDIKWTIGIPKESIQTYDNNYISFYEKRTTFARIKTVEHIKKIDHDCQIHFDGLNYYICVPETVTRKTNSKNWFCALDPGVRKFQTLYSPDENHYIKIGDRASKKMYMNLLLLDNLLSKNSKLKILKLRTRIRNLQEELHNKTINYICNNYQNVYIPKLTKMNDIIKSDKRKLKTKTVRSMVVLGHCKFVEKLKTKAETFTNVKIHVINEDYTSQMCLKCNKLTKTSSEWYKCNYCDFDCDRDILGSTNILLKNW